MKQCAEEIDEEIRTKKKKAVVMAYPSPVPRASRTEESAFLETEHTKESLPDSSEVQNGWNAPSLLDAIEKSRELKSERVPAEVIIAAKLLNSLLPTVASKDDRRYVRPPKDPAKLRFYNQSFGEGKFCFPVPPLRLNDAPNPRYSSLEGTTVKYLR